MNAQDNFLGVSVADTASCLVTNSSAVRFLLPCLFNTAASEVTLAKHCYNCACTAQASEAGAQLGHALPASRQPYAIPEAVPKGRHGPIGSQRSKSALDRAAHSSAGLPNGAAGAGPSQEGPQTQPSPGSNFSQGFGGFSQDGYGMPRDYDFKSQDSLQSDNMYLTQQFPAYQTQVTPFGNVDVYIVVHADWASLALLGFPCQFRPFWLQVVIATVTSYYSSCWPI